MTTTTSTDLAQRVEGSGAPMRAKSGTAGLVELMAPQFARALPAHIPAERFTRLALTTLSSSEALKRCTPESFLGALMTCAQLGLEPNTPTGEAYLIPYGNVCTFVPGYRGLTKLAWQSGQVTELYAELVHDKDVFEYELGLDRRLRHVPHPEDDRGAVVGAYAVVKMAGGGVAFDYWPLSRIRAHQAAHSKRRSAKAPDDLAGWMDRKTVLKQVLKLVPASSSLSAAVANDGSVRTDLSFSALDVIEGEGVDLPDVTDAEVLEDVVTEGGAS